MLHRGAARDFTGDLRGVRGRFTRPFKALRTGRRPRDCVALSVGDRDDRVIERRIDVRDARCNILAFAAAGRAVDAALAMISRP